MTGLILKIDNSVSQSQCDVLVKCIHGHNSKLLSWFRRVRGKPPDNDAHKPLVMSDISDIGLTDYNR